MALLNLTQAAKLANVSRVTLNKHLKNGRQGNKITTVEAADGSTRIDEEEIRRVYGSLVNDTVNGRVNTEQRLQSENEALRAELHAVNKLLVEKDNRIQDLHKMYALLTEKISTPPPAAAPEPPAPARPWWRFW